MDTIAMDIRTVRSRLVDRALIFFAAVTPLALALSIGRTFEHGWHPLYFFHIGGAGSVIAAAVFRKRLPYGVRAFSLVGSVFLTGASGLLAFGLVTGAIAALFFLFALVTIIAFGVMYEHLAASLRDLQESRNFFKEIAANIPGVIFQFYATQKGEYGMSYVGERAEDIFGISSDTNGFYERFLSGIAEEDRAGFSASVAEAVRTVGRWKFEGKFIKPSGETLWIQCSSHPTKKGENFVANGVAMDITERKIAEIALQKSEENYRTLFNSANDAIFLLEKDEEDKKKTSKRLQQAQKMEAIGTLAGGIAHDFNNILSSILGFSELVKYDLPEDNPESIENIESVIKAGLRAKELVKHILTFSRYSEADRAPVILSMLVKEVVKLLRASLPTSIETKVDILHNNATVFGDAGQIHQVLMNLCVNAAHAMKPEGGILEIRVEKVTLSENDIPEYEEMAPGGCIRLTVSDTGHGIAEDIIDRVFDPFFTTKARGEGSGMGLSVVHGIVKDMQGCIQVESEPGNGTVFHVMLPEYDGTAESETSVRPQAPQKGKGRILFVDDEQAIVTMTSRALERLGYDVMPMTGSLDALDTFAADPEAFDLVITDLDMPKLNGIEFSRRILEKRPNMPIILCTGFTDNIMPEAFEEIGIHRLMMKPLVLTELADVVKNVVEPNK